MKRVLGLSLAVACLCGTSRATDLNLNVQSNDGATLGSDTVTVGPGDSVPYRVMGLLSDDLNEGLALAGFDLVFDGGDLPPADAPSGVLSCANPMVNFMIPDGITNPAGIGGTQISGELVQVGGGQNTIKNTSDFADFPLGTVLMGVAQPGGCGEAMLIKGTLTAPMALGEYHLTIPPTSVFANVIDEGQTGAEAFWASVPAGVGTIGNMTIIVGDVLVQLVSSNPVGSAPGEPAADTLWRSAKSVLRFTFNGDITSPGPGEVEIREMQAGGVYGSDLSSSFAFSVENDGGGNPRVLRIQDTGSTLQHRKWYAFRNTGGWTPVASFELQYGLQIGDADNNGLVLSLDVGAINGGIPCVFECGDDNRLDMDGDGRVLSLDVGVVNGHIPSLVVPKPPGF